MKKLQLLIYSSIIWILLSCCKDEQRINNLNEDLRGFTPYVEGETKLFKNRENETFEFVVNRKYDDIVTTFDTETNYLTCERLIKNSTHVEYTQIEMMLKNSEGVKSKRKLYYETNFYITKLYAFSSDLEEYIDHLYIVGPYDTLIDPSRPYYLIDNFTDFKSTFNSPNKAYEDVYFVEGRVFNSRKKERALFKSIGFNRIDGIVFFETLDGDSLWLE